MPDFPDDFTFGVATAAYQVEGHITNDWTDWELAGKLKDKNARNGRGIEHWARFDSDVELIKGLGVGAYRLSLEWARIEPEPGRFDDAVLDGYRRRLELLKKKGLRPIVTLHHFTHPRWFHAQTPWHEPSSLVSWERYAKKCAELLDGLDAAVVTINEPMVLLLGGWFSGLMPPGLNDPALGWKVLQNFARAHVIARRALVDRHQTVTVGIAQHQMEFSPARWWHPIDQALTRLADAHFNYTLLEALTTGELKVGMPGFFAGTEKIDGGKDAMEFIGINYYTRSHLKFLPRPPWVEFVFRDPLKRGLTDIGWEWYPEGFGRLLEQLKRFNKPVWITENGIDDREGGRRNRFLYEHLRQVLKAREDGVDVRAYLHWSMFDNFEWLEAWGPRFGLYRVDFESLERTPTPTAEYYRKIVTSKTLVPP